MPDAKLRQIYVSDEEWEISRHAAHDDRIFLREWWRRAGREKVERDKTREWIRQAIAEKLEEK